MASVNKAIILGHLGQDPETRYLPSGDAVTNISVATSEKWKGKDGSQQEHTEWHRVSFFGKTAEIAGEYLKKGSPVYIEGRIRTRKWQDKDGQDKYSTEIVGDRLQLLGGKAQASGETPEQKPARKQSGGFDQMADDIPFAPIGRGIGGHAI